jgi:sugar lactone lactonase YvrE
MPAPAFRRPARLLLACLLPLAAACDHDPTPSLYPDQITFNQTALYPEGSQYDNQNRRFLVSSQTAGRIGQVDLDGNYTSFADDASLVSTIGLNLDAPRNRLLVAVSDPGYNSARTSTATQRQLAALASFDSNSGARLSYVSLGSLRPGYATHFANDIAVDNLGNAYVTDSFAPLIYKVDTQGTASVFLENTALGAPAGSFGLNGIVYHPDGYLLVAKSDEGALLKVPLNNPSGFSRVGASGLTLSGADGLQLHDNNTLLVACNAQGQVYRLRSTDGFSNVSGTGSFATGAVYPTTLPRLGTTSYVLYAHLDALQKMQNPPISTFTLARVQF